METPEVPTEHLHEQLQENAEQFGGWVMRVALSSAVAAALAAVAALLAGHTANEAMLKQIEASNKWNYFQAKSIKASILRSKTDLLVALGKAPAEKDAQKAHEYEGEQETIQREAESLGHESEHFLRQHRTISHSVTLFQISIAVAAMSVLVRNRRLWMVGLLFGTGGLVFLLLGLLVH